LEGGVSHYNHYNHGTQLSLLAVESV